MTASPERAAEGARGGVTLVCMPWATTARPSLALGILSEVGRAVGVPVRSLYPNLDLVAELGFEVGNAFAHRQVLSGLAEHLFACDLFGPQELASEEFLGSLADRELPEGLSDPAVLHRLRDEVIPAFLDRTVQRVLAGAPAVVGVTATFNQVMSGLALCARVKAADPAIITVAGGACFGDPMGQEYHRALPKVLDHVFVAEAEESFAAFADRLRTGSPTAGIAGVTWWDGERVQLIPGHRLADLNASPVPDYGDFFAEADRVHRETGYAFNVDYLPFESSRGCWWGKRRHCVFCGTNPELLPFREKTPQRVVAEVVGLSARYRTPRLVASDLIVSRTSRREIWGRLQPRPAGERAATPAELDAVVAELLERDVLMREGDLLLSLPVGRRPRTTDALRAYVLGPPTPSRT
jgi:ribosomal peptide maturation radical SAM protein 1